MAEELYSIVAPEDEEISVESIKFKNPDDDPRGAYGHEEEEIEEETTEETEEEEEEAEETTSETETTETEEETEETAESEAEETTATTEDSETEVDQGQIFHQLSENTGVEISSPDDLVSSLKELADLRANKYADLSQSLKQAIEFEQKGGDVAHFFRINSLDYDTLSGKEVLMQKYFKENSEIYKADPDLAKLKFEREYQREYGILDKKFEDEEEESIFKTENAVDLDIAKRSLELDVNKARAEMNALKVKELEIEPKNKETGLTEAEENILGDQYEANMNKALQELKTIPVSIGDNKSFNFGVTGETLEKVKSDLANPSKFLESIGVTGKSIDAEKLAQFVAWKHAKDNVGELLMNYLKESNEKDTVKKIVENTTTETTAGGGGGEKSLDEKVAEAFRAKFG